MPGPRTSLMHLSLAMAIATVSFMDTSIPAQARTSPIFKALAFYENGGHHIEYSRKGIAWLNQLAADSNFVIDYRTGTDDFSDDFLSQYQLLIQLDFVPYGWSDKAKKAFSTYIDNSRGGWVGFHHASLLGDFDGYHMWPWFFHFMGGIRFDNYIPDFASGTVHLEDSTHPVFRNVPKEFTIQREEWYTYDHSPRSNVHVLADLDEASYRPDSIQVKMGDHPVIWINPKVKAKNIYIFMGHGPDLWDNAVYTTIVRNAIFWAAKKS